MQPPNSGHIDVTRISSKPHNMIQCIQEKSFNNIETHLKQHLHTFALKNCGWFRNPARKPVEVGGLYVVYPTIYKGFNTSRCRISSINSMFDPSILGSPIEPPINRHEPEFTEEPKLHALLPEPSTPGNPVEAVRHSQAPAFHG